MSVFTPEVEILGLLAVFVSDFLSSSCLPSKVFFIPILMLHIHSSCSLWFHKKEWEKKFDLTMSIFTLKVKIFIY